MSIYDEGKIKMDFKFDLGKSKPLLIIVILAAVIAVVWFFAVSPLIEALKPSAIEIKFSANPLDLTLKGNNSTIMYVTVSNVFGGDERNVLVKAKPIDETSIVIYPPESSIEVLGKNEKRKINFVIRPNEKIVSGNYEIEVELIINNQSFLKRATLAVKNY